MGLNATIMICTDGLGAIERDLENWWKQINRGIQLGPSYGERISAGNHANLSKVVSVAHADHTQVVAVGGNTGKLMGMSRHHTEEKILRDLADQMGYYLAKKPKRG